jgi:hypothetical protein
MKDSPHEGPRDDEQRSAIEQSECDQDPESVDQASSDNTTETSPDHQDFWPDLLMRRHNDHLFDPAVPQKEPSHFHARQTKVAVSPRQIDFC